MLTAKRLPPSVPLTVGPLPTLTVPGAAAEPEMRIVAVCSCPPLTGNVPLSEHAGHEGEVVQDHR